LAQHAMRRWRWQGCASAQWWSLDHSRAAGSPMRCAMHQKRWRCGWDGSISAKGNASAADSLLANRNIASHGRDAHAAPTRAGPACRRLNVVVAPEPARASRIPDVERKVAVDAQIVRALALFQLDIEGAVEVGRKGQLDLAAEGVEIEVVTGTPPIDVDADLAAHGAHFRRAGERADVDVSAHGLGDDLPRAAGDPDIAAHRVKRRAVGCIR